MNAQIVGLGACVLDTLITLPAYPREDTKRRALESRRTGGGPAATGLIAAAKLGMRAQYLGVLAGDADGSFLRRDFERYGVDTSLVRMADAGRGFTSSVWLSQEAATRTCVFDRGSLPALVLDDAMRAAVAGADVLLLDGNEPLAAQEAARTAKESGAVVLYDCGAFDEGAQRLLALADVAIPSAEAARAAAGCADLSDAARALKQRYAPRAVVITDGKNGGVWLEDGEPQRYPAFPVGSVDTNGAGDVFHGAFAAGLVRGLSTGECCLFASAASALKCTGVGARESAPTWERTAAFLRARGVGFARL